MASRVKEMINADLPETCPICDEEIHFIIGWIARCVGCKILCFYPYQEWRQMAGEGYHC
jgi:hypothetical protein